MIRKIFCECNIELSEKQVQQFQNYYELLIEWNRKINLTAITEYEEVIWKHFIDSALLTKSNLYQEKEKNSILDMGTGAGFPGIVLAILSPEKKFTLVDSLQKRIDFLTIVIKELELENVILFHGRAEDYGQKLNFRNQFDFVVSRAVAELPLLLEYCIPFVKVDGYFISYKGKKYKDEIDCSVNAFKKLTCQIENIEKFVLKNREEERILLFIKNNATTNSKYPRRAGKPKKKPL